MALQFLYSSWWENETEHTIHLASEGLSAEDTEYILRIVSVTDRYGILPEVDENEELANTLYLQLPSSAYTIVRTGLYTVNDSTQENNLIVHAYVQENGEEISPMLYAINNCFRIALTKEEQEQLLQQDSLPATPFPRPQFKLSQAEIRKFFSQGRLRTLSCLLQAVIDSHGNQRIIILNDNYHSIKYWFYGIHSCLPTNRTSRLTYSTYAFNKPEDCIFICSAPGHTINLDELAEEGNFVIDNLDDIGCGDIESARFAKWVVQVFWQDVSLLPEMLEGVEALMDAYHLNVATAAGLYKLTQFDFEWFNSAHEIHYFLGKVGTIDKNSLEMISHKLWVAFSNTDFKFKINSDNLPILAYIFRNTNDEVRWQIISYVDEHIDELFLRDFTSFDDMYTELCDKLSFITEFIPLSLMQSGTIQSYCERRQICPAEAAAFFRIIVDNYDEYVTILTEDVVIETSAYLLEYVLHHNALTIAYSICSEACHLPYDFLRYVIVQGILNDANAPDENDTTKLHLPDSFVYSIARLLITKDPTLALEFVKNHAREGKYGESTLKLYNDLCRDFPLETTDYNDTLHERAVYADFVTDSVFYKFASLQNATREELTDFFTNYYLTEKDRKHYFETKILQHLNQELPVRAIETAVYFFTLLISSAKEPEKYPLFNVLISFILGQSAMDLFDYFNSDPDALAKIQKAFSTFAVTASSSFQLSSLLILLSVPMTDEANPVNVILEAWTNARSENYLHTDAFSPEFGYFFIEKLIRFSNTLAPHLEWLSEFTKRVIFPIFQTPQGMEWGKNVFHSRMETAPDTLYPLTARLIILLKENENSNHTALTNIILELLDTIPSKRRREVYRSFLSYSQTASEKEYLKVFLAYAYYRSFSGIGRIFARSKRYLFGKEKKTKQQ